MSRARLLITALALAASTGVAAEQPGDLQVWRGFQEALRSGAMADTQRYRPLQPSLLEPMMGYLEEIRRNGTWVEDDRGPEVFHVGSRVHYLARLALQRGDTTSTGTYCFSFVLERGRWYFQHLEGIVIRLDKIGTPPVSSFPDVSTEQKAWIREEVQVSRDVRLFRDLSRERGKESAFNWFKDGHGYALQARVWVPFVSPEQAFILYVCWDLADLRDEKVVLEALDENEARIRFAPRVLAIYDHASHLKQQISRDDYRRLFETVWLDRASSAGWDLRIAYEKDDCVFHLVRRGPGSGAR